MTWTIIAVLLILGLIFLLLEILVFPGTSVAGIIGFALMVVAIWQTYTTYGRIAGHIMVAGTIITSVVAVYFSLKSKTWERASLKTEITGHVNDISLEKFKPGVKGISSSRLAPMGKALIMDEYIEVRCESSFVDPNTEIIITRIEDNKIFVKPIENN